MNDFLKNNTEPDIIKPEVFHGPNLRSAKNMTRRQFAQGVLNVYQELGGDSWLLQQAKIDPKTFLDFLKKLIPNSINVDDLSDMQITLVNRYGDRIELAAAQDRDLTHSSPGTPPLASVPQLEQGVSASDTPKTVTGNSRYRSELAEGQHNSLEDVPDIEVTEVYNRNEDDIEFI